MLRVDNALSALLESGFEEGDDLTRVASELVGEFFVIRDDMRDVDVAVELFHQHVLADLVSVDVCSIELEDKNELL